MIDAGISVYTTLNVQLLARGLISLKTGRIGNFWVDLIRGTLYILLPLSFVLALLLLVSQGVIQSP